MEINSLIIDDEHDKRTLSELREDLQFKVNENSSISLHVNLDYENPINFISENFNLKPFFQHLDDKYLSKKLDMLLCDFNLHATYKHIAFHIIDHVRKKNKACTIILFSGSPLKELIRINNNDLAIKISEHIVEQNNEVDVGNLEKKLEELRREEEPAEELMQIAVKSNISAIVSRTRYEETALDLITTPSLILWLENELLKNGNLIFNDGHEILNGMKLEDIAKHVREQTEFGVYFTKEILQVSIASLVKFNS